MLPRRETEARSTEQRGSSTRAFLEPCRPISFGVALRGLPHTDTPRGDGGKRGEGCRPPQPPVPRIIRLDATRCQWMGANDTCVMGFRQGEGWGGREMGGKTNLWQEKRLRSIPRCEIKRKKDAFCCRAVKGEHLLGPEEGPRVCSRARPSQPAPAHALCHIHRLPLQGPDSLGASQTKAGAALPAPAPRCQRSPVILGTFSAENTTLHSL